MRRKDSRHSAREAARDALGVFKRAILLPDEEFVESRHFGDQMAQAGFDMHDVRRLAHQGRITKEPEWDTERRAWKWCVEGRSVEDRWLGVIFNVLGPRRVKAITVLRRER